MERKPVRMKAEYGIATKENSLGYMTESFPASEQFSTRSCIRCKGLLVTEWNYDLQNPDTHNIEIFRCVQCGNRIDPVILQNQTRALIKPRCVKLVRPICAVRGVSLNEVA